MRPNLLLAGNHLSSRGGGSRGPIEDLAERLGIRGYRCLCISSVRNGFLRGMDLLFSTMLRRADYDVAVVDLYSGRAFLWGEALSATLGLLKRPFVITLHGGGLPDFAETRVRRVQRCLARASAVTAPSRYLLERMSRYRADIQLLPNPIDLSNYSYRNRDKVEMRLVWVRAFHKIYNPQMATRVLALLPEARLTMVGGDKGDGSLISTKTVANDLGVAGRLQFTGPIARDQVSDYLQQADIFINTTDFDNTPVSVIEAMACGLCVVSTNVGGVSHLIDNGIDGLLVPPGDEEAMAAAVRKIAGNPEFAQRLSRNARAKAERFDWTHVLPQWESLLDAIAGAKSSNGASNGARQYARSNF